MGVCDLLSDPGFMAFLGAVILIYFLSYRLALKGNGER
jgi:hypothetical protein